MSDELIIVKAARNYADDIDNDLGIEMGLPDCLREAANLIERLTAQVEGFQDEIKRLGEQVRFASETDPAMRAEAAEAEAARLKGALEALAGEVERLKDQNTAWADKYGDTQNAMYAALDERDRLKNALRKKLSAKARQKLGDLSESMIAMGDGHSLEMLLNWYDESRKAVGGDAS